MRLTVVSSRIPYPLDRGDKLRLYHQLRILSAHFDLHLISLTDTEPNESIVQEIQSIVHHFTWYKIPTWLSAFSVVKSFLWGSRPMQVDYFYQKEIKKKIQTEIQKSQPDALYIQLGRTYPYVPADCTMPVVVDLMDAFSYGAQLRAKDETLWWKRWFWKKEFGRLIEYEKKITAQVPYTTIISEKDSIRLNYTRKPTIVENGIDIDSYPVSSNVVTKYDLAFVGNMSYHPNKKAHKYIVQKILPSYKNIYARSLSYLVAGRNSSSLSANTYVHIGGWYDNIADAYASAKVFVAPIYHGMGQQNKILEAIALKRPVVCAQRIAEPLGLQDKIHVRIADTPEEYARAIHDIVKHEEASDEMVNNAYHYILNEKSWEKTTQSLIHIFNSLNKQS